MQPESQHGVLLTQLMYFDFIVITDVNKSIKNAGSTRSTLLNISSISSITFFNIHRAYNSPVSKLQIWLTLRKGEGKVFQASR